MSAISNIQRKCDHNKTFQLYHKLQITTETFQVLLKQSLLTTNQILAFWFVFRLKDATRQADRMTKTHKNAADTFIRISSCISQMGTSEYMDIDRFLNKVLLRNLLTVQPKSQFSTCVRNYCQADR